MTAVNGKPGDAVWKIMDELIDAVKTLHPRMYESVLKNLMIFEAWAANCSPLNILLECKEKVLTLSNMRVIMCTSERERKSQTPERARQ